MVPFGVGTLSFELIFQTHKLGIFISKNQCISNSTWQFQSQQCNDPLSFEAFVEICLWVEVEVNQEQVAVTIRKKLSEELSCLQSLSPRCLNWPRRKPSRGNWPQFIPICYNNANAASLSLIVIKWFWKQQWCHQIVLSMWKSMMNHADVFSMALSVNNWAFLISNHSLSLKYLTNVHFVLD